MYNSKYPYFIKYSKKDFREIEDFLNNDEIREFLREKKFFYEEDELERVVRNHKEQLESKETLSLIIKVTRDCNFRCVYCYENFDNCHLDTNKSEAIVKFVENKLFEEKYKNINISWFGGEPLLNLEAIYYISSRVISYVRKKVSIIWGR